MYNVGKVTKKNYFNSYKLITCVKRAHTIIAVCKKCGKLLKVDKMDKIICLWDLSTIWKVDFFCEMSNNVKRHNMCTNFLSSIKEKKNQRSEGESEA